jgi:hypothetical protein
MLPFDDAFAQMHEREADGRYADGAPFLHEFLPMPIDHGHFVVSGEANAEARPLVFDFGFAGADFGERFVKTPQYAASVFMESVEHIAENQGRTGVALRP